MRVTPGLPVVAMTALVAATVGVVPAMATEVPHTRPADAATSGSAAAQTATSPHRGSRQWLVVADDVAETVSVVKAGTGKVTGTLSGLKFGVHSGTVQLGHGRIAFIDDSRQRLDVLAIGPAGRPRIVAHYAIPSLAGPWEGATWLATDPTRRYLAVSAGPEDSTTQQATIIDRRTGRSNTAAIPISTVSVAGSGLATEEMEVFLVGTPLRLVVTAGGHLDAYSAKAILGGADHPRARARTALSAYPHGPIANNQGTVIGSNVALGEQTVRVTKRGFGASSFSLYPYAAEQSYRPSMAPDGTPSLFQERWSWGPPIGLAGYHRVIDKGRTAQLYQGKPDIQGRGCQAKGTLQVF